jgi:Ca2+/H+ antiporter
MVASALALIGMSFLSYAAAASVRYSPWTPTLGGIIFSIPLLVAGAVLWVAITDRTRQGFTLQRGRLYLGALGLLMWIALALAYVVQIGDSSTYEGAYNREKQRWEPNFSQQSFFMLTVGMALIYPTGASIAAARFLYFEAIRPVSAIVEGRDPIGEMIAGRLRNQS